MAWVCARARAGVVLGVVMRDLAVFGGRGEDINIYLLLVQCRAGRIDSLNQIEGWSEQGKHECRSTGDSESNGTPVVVDQMRGD